MDSPLILFYSGEGADHKGRHLSTILQWPDWRLEQTHDFIQWLFPTRQASIYNANAPLLTDQDVAAFRSRPHLMGAFGQASERMRVFYRLEDSHPLWVTPGNHNYLRLTRILRSLTDIGLRDRVGNLESIGLLAKLEALAERTEGIPAKTLWFWRQALLYVDIPG